jgi:hypothetical protein
MANRILYAIKIHWAYDHKTRYVQIVPPVLDRDGWRLCSKEERTLLPRQAAVGLLSAVKAYFDNGSSSKITLVRVPVK